MNAPVVACFCRYDSELVSACVFKEEPVDICTYARFYNRSESGMPVLTALTEAPLFQAEPRVLEEYCNSCFDADGCILEI